MTKAIDAKDKALKEVLGSVQYSIDFYQRDYKWQAKQVEELVSDLTSRFLDSFRNTHVRADVASYPSYFLGSIVLSKKSDGIYIVDGQQRLTTLTLLLIYLRNLQVASQMAEDPNVQSLIQSTQFGRTNFNMNVADRREVIEALYRGDRLDEEPEDLSSATIQSRYIDIETTFPEECKGDTLPFFMDWLIERVQLVEISAYSDEDAYTVFETMNDRGLSLSPSDMLKGFLLSNIRDQGARQKAEERWKESVPRLQALSAKDATNDFFRTWFRGRYAQSYGPSTADYERLGPEFHRWLRENADNVGLKHSDDYAAFVQRQVPLYSSLYRDICNHQVSYDPKHACLYFVGEARIDDGLLLMAAVSESDSPAQIAEKTKVVSRFLDIFVHRRVWASRNLTKPALKGTFVSLARDLRSLPYDELVARLFAELTKPEHDDFETSPPALTGATRRRVHRLLARLISYVEVHGGSGNDPYADLVVVSGRSRFDVEHIWPNKFDEYADLFADQAEFSDYRNRLGALLLIPHSFNTSYSAMPTSEKLALYGRSDHHLLVASLASSAYERNPRFKQWLEATQLPFTPYDSVGFTKQAAEARVDLYRALARMIWSPTLLIEDSGLDAELVIDMAEAARAGLETESADGGRTRTFIDVSLRDLVSQGMLTPGDILVGVRAGKTAEATAIVLDDGVIELSNGERYSAPSGASMALGLPGVVNGWEFWVQERTGRRLADLRDDLRQVADV